MTILLFYKYIDTYINTIIFMCNAIDYYINTLIFNTYNNLKVIISWWLAGVSDEITRTVQVTF